MTLNISTCTTLLGDVKDLDISKKVDQLKASLLKTRRKFLERYEVSYEEEYYESLDQEEIEYLLDLLKNPEIDESECRANISFIERPW